MRQHLPGVPEPLLVVHNKKYRAPRTQPWQGKHPHHLLSMMVRASGYYRVGPLELQVDGPGIGLHPAGDDDVDGLAGPVEAWWCGFHWAALRIRWHGVRELDLTWNGRRMRVPRRKTLDAASLTRLVEIYAALRKALARPDLAGAAKTQGLFMELFSTYLDLPGEEGAGGVGHRALARFCVLLQKRACDDVTLEDLADEAGGSADHLRGLFRDRFGVRPVQFRTRLRLARARELLSSTTKNVSEVAQRVGYPDPLYFSRVFRRYFGISPREMIRRYRLPGI